MSPSLRSLLVTLVLAALAGAIGVWVGAKYMVEQPNAASSLHQLLHDELHLSTDQKTKIDALEATFSETRRMLEAEMKRANADLAAAILAHKRDSPEVQTAVDRFHTAQGALQKETISHIFEMRSVLTAEQAEKFDAKVAQSLTADSQ
jgi:nickel and cobalt resistance protein CnrR